MYKGNKSTRNTHTLNGKIRTRLLLPDNKKRTPEE